MRDIALNFSRPGGQVVCQYYNFLRLGREGYRKIHDACYATAQYLAEQLAKVDLFEMLYDGKTNEIDNDNFNEILSVVRGLAANDERIIDYFKDKESVELEKSKYTERFIFNET